MKTLLLLLVLISASSQLFGQQTRYIHDQLYVPVRSGETTGHRIIKLLNSGTALTVIKENADKKWSFVRTNKGIEGWMQTQYLTSSPVSKDLLKVANASLARLKQENGNLKKQLSEIKTQDGNNQRQLASLSKNNAQISKELENIKAISANAVQINRDNNRLLEENQMLINKVEILTTDNQRLVDDQESDAFMNGAFAVLIGVMITLIVPRLWPRKSTDWA